MPPDKWSQTYVTNNTTGNWANLTTYPYFAEPTRYEAGYAEAVSVEKSKPSSLDWLSGEVDRIVNMGYLES